jgi:beta-N-acetylhexosaminidase
MPLRPQYGESHRVNDLHRLARGVICVGFGGTALDAPLERRLRELSAAGVILFARNIETPAQTRKLTDALRSLYPDLTPVLAIDQEGGRVARLRNGVEELPSMMALAACDDVELAEHAGEQLGFDLRRAGVNLDFAPVLDLALFVNNTVIGARSFGSDPKRVAMFAGAFANGLRRAGMVPTFKHFPGHGSTEVDSHLDLPVIDLDEETLRSRDLQPFVELLPSAEGVMTAHIVTRAFDRERAATISSAILTDLLREEIGFKGVCFTDCMQMDAIAKGIGSVEGAVQAIAAGADCVLISHSIDLAMQSADAIASAVENGQISLARLQEAYDRVCALRRSLRPPISLDAPAPYGGIGREIGRRAVSVLRGDAYADPHTSIVVSFEGATVEGVQGLHTYHAPLGDGLAIETLRLPLQPRAGDAGLALNRIHASSKRPVVLMRRAHVYGEQRDTVEQIVSAFPDALLVSAREPFDSGLFPAARNVLCTYGDDAPSMQGLSDVIFGAVV